MPGFWSSNLIADISLVVQILFYLVLCAGVVAQLQGKYKLHDRLQIPVVGLNIFFIAFVMIPTFRSVVGDLPGNLNQVPTIITLIHAGLGTVAQLLAIYCLLAGLKILPRKIGVLRYWMWAAYTAWTATVIFGIGVYITFYLSPAASASSPEVVTEHDADLVSEQAAPEDETTSQPVPQATPAQTEETVTEHAEEPVVTPTQAEPTKVIVSEEENEEAATPSAPADTGPMDDEGTFSMDEMIDEHAGEATTVDEPVFSGEAAQAQWQAMQPTSPGPSPRYEHAMAYNAATNRLFVFGGRDGNQIFNDVWALNLDTLSWRQLAADASLAPPARFSTVMMVDEAGENLYIATGHTQDGKNFNDIWKLDLATETWAPLTESAGQAPEPRYGAPGGNLNGHLVTTHGFGNTRYDDTWRFNIATEQWENITPSGPVPLRRCLFAAAPTDTSLVIHGGCAAGFGDCFLDDTWVLDTGDNAWRQLLSDVKPVGRQYHSLVALGPEQLVLFGGQDASRAARNDLWLLNLESGNWQLIEAAAGPEVRYQHASVWVPELGMVLFGGRNEGALGDMWLLSLQPAATEAPSPQPTPQATPPPQPTPTPPPPTPTPELISEHDGE